VDGEVVFALVVLPADVTPEVPLVTAPPLVTVETWAAVVFVV